MFVSKKVKLNKVLKVDDLIAFTEKDVNVFDFIEEGGNQVSLLAMKKGMELKEQVTTGEVFFLDLEGTCTLVLDEDNYTLTKNNFVVAKKGIKMTVKANSDTRFLIILVEEGPIVEITKNEIYDIQDFITNSDRNSVIIDQKHLYVSLYRLDANQYIERVIGLKDVIAHNLDGDTDLMIDDQRYRLSQDQLITIAANSIYQLHTIEDTKILSIEVK